MNSSKIINSLLVIFFILILTIDASASLREGLVGWWKFDETSGTSAFDSSGIGNTGTLNNSPTWTTNCKIMNCLTFNASNSTVTINAYTALTPSFPFSIATWVYIPTTGSLWGLFDYGKVRVTINEGTSQWVMDNFGAQPSVSTQNVVYNQWVHLVITLDSTGSFKWYFNGQLDNTTACGSSCNPRDVGIYIGGLREGYYSGAKIDDFRIYNRVLNAGEVKDLFQADNAHIVNASIRNAVFNQ